MSVLAEQTYLGKLRILEVYEATDEPCLFAARNGAGQIFLVVLLDETEVVKDWLYVPLSDDRFAQVRFPREASPTGSIDLYQAFRSAEDGFVHWVSVPIDDGSAIVKTIDCEALTNDWLPIEGDRLSLEVAQVA